MKKIKAKKIISLFLAIFMIFIMIFSVGYIASHLHHDCTGDDCPICFEMQICLNTIKIFSIAVIAAVILLGLQFKLQKNKILSQEKKINSSLFSLKVKLND